MMRVGPYKVSFRHDVELGTTECTIMTPTGLDSVKILASGFAFCNLKCDQFNKNIGRKLSLTKALKHWPVADKHLRRQFWGAYHMMRGGKW